MGAIDYIKDYVHRHYHREENHPLRTPHGAVECNPEFIDGDVEIENEEASHSSDKPVLWRPGEVDTDVPFG